MNLAFQAKTLLRASNTLDFDDLLVYWYVGKAQAVRTHTYTQSSERLFQVHPNAVRYVKHVLVDEVHIDHAISIQQAEWKSIVSRHERNTIRYSQAHGSSERFFDDRGRSGPEYLLVEERRDRESALYALRYS